MVKLACNYLNELKELIEEKRITNIDYIKIFSIVPRLFGFEWAIENGYKIMLHGFPGIGNNMGTIDYFENADFDMMKKCVERSRTPYLSFHINISKTKKQLEIKNSMNDEEYTKKVIEIFKYNVSKIKEIFKLDILLETHATRPETEPEICRRPEVINEILEKADCGLLFDLSHSRRIARILDITLEEFINKIDMKKIKEIHINGMMKNKIGEWEDTHSKLREEDYEKIEKLLIEYPNIEILTLEYGATGEIMDEETRKNAVIVTENGVNPEAKEELYEQIIRLQEIIRKVNKTV